MKRIITATVILAACLALTGCATAHAERVEDTAWEPRDIAAGVVDEAPAETVDEGETQDEQDAEPAPEQPDYDTGDCEYDAEWYPTDGLTREGGVNWYGDTLETWYSSQTLYHYRTSEWTADEEGFYRTADGYYVVASEDYPEGTVIETSKGLAQVLDGGCESGVVDFYVEW